MLPAVPAFSLVESHYGTSLREVFPVSVLCQLQVLFREMPKNLVFRRPVFRASRCQDVEFLGGAPKCLQTGRMLVKPVKG